MIADYGPVVDGWEADFAKTYIIGNDARKIKLKADTEAAWHEANDWYGEQEHLTGAVFYNGQGLNGAYCQDTGIRRINDRRELINAKHTQVGNGERAAFPIGRL